MPNKNKETEVPQCVQTSVSRSRCVGKTHEMVLQIKKTLEERGECGVGMLQDPTDILKRLTDLGVENVTAKPTHRTMMPMIQRNEYGEPIGLLDSEVVKTGFVFYYG